MNRPPLRTPSRTTDDLFFPLPISALQSWTSHTLTYDYVSHLHPPFHAINNLYFRNTCQMGSPVTSKETLEQSIGDVFNSTTYSETTWKLFTPEDAHYSAGFTDVVFNGMKVVHSDDITILQDTPALEEMKFHPNPNPRWDSIPPSDSQNEARRHLQMFSESRHKSSGCNEDRIFGNSGHPCASCLNTFETIRDAMNPRAAQEDMWFRRFHCQPNCRRNKSVHTLVNNLNLSTISESDAAANYTHIFRISPIEQRELTDEKSQLFLQQRLPIRGNDHLRRKVSKLEVGFLQPDSGLQTSLELNKKIQNESKVHPYLKHSPKFRAEQTELRQSLAGPAIATPSQAFNMAAFAERQLQDGNWRDLGPDRPLSIAHPG